MKIGMGCAMCGTGTGQSCDHITYMDSEEFYALFEEMDSGETDLV